MAFLHFRRHTRSTVGNPGAPVCTAPSSALRQWQVDVILSTLSQPVREALRVWLLAPTDLWRWPPPAKFTARRDPLHREAITDLKTASDLLYAELRVLRQTLDFPPEAISVLAHNGLLITHAMRLRQLEGWLRPQRAAWMIRQMIA
jgi:hypothetical protein